MGSDSSERFARVASAFTACVEAVPEDAWSRPAPCEGWTARDVVRHLVEWLPGPGFLLGTFGVPTGPIPSVEDDPAGAWGAVRDAIQAGLDDPVVAQRVEDCGPPGQLSFEAAVDMTCTPDVLIHTWDLATATGQPAQLDPGLVDACIAMFLPDMPERGRAGGIVGPAVPVADDAAPQDRLLAAMGRTP